MCWVSTTCFNSTAVEAEGIYDKNMRRKFIVIGEIFFPEFIITFFKKYISGKIFPFQLIYYLDQVWVLKKLPNSRYFH